MTNRLRSHLREFYPAALLAFQGAGNPGLDSRRARVVLAAAPTPAVAAKLTRSQRRALLKRADYLHQLPQVEQAMGQQALALIQQLDATCNSVDQLAAATEEAFLAHPDADIITSFLGLSVLSGARVLAEIGETANASQTPER